MEVQVRTSETGQLPFCRQPGLVICVSGPSGVGKGTVIAAARQRNSKLVHSISVTTRSPRAGETEGVSYYFRSKEEFDRLRVAGEILEYDEYCGHHYGTPLAPLRRMVESGQDVILDLTVPGSLATMRCFPDAISIFLLPPSIEELRRRLEERATEDQYTIERRMEQALDEIRRLSLFGYVIINDELDRAVNDILTIVAAERHRTTRMRGIEEQILQHGG